MTTKFLTIKFAKFSNFPNFIVREFPRKSSVLDNFPSIFPLPNPLQNANFINMLLFLGKFHDNKIWKIREILRILLSEILLSFGRLLLWGFMRPLAPGTHFQLFFFVFGPEGRHLYFSHRPSPLLGIAPPLNNLQEVDFRSILGQILVNFNQKRQKPTENRPKTDSKLTTSRILTRCLHLRGTGVCG